MKYFYEHTKRLFKLLNTLIIYNHNKWDMKALMIVIRSYEFETATSDMMENSL